MRRGEILQVLSTVGDVVISVLSRKEISTPVLSQTQKQKQKLLPPALQTDAAGFLYFGIKLINRTSREFCLLSFKFNEKGEGWCYSLINSFDSQE